jgi:lipid-A-disaccharide synthase-like uncharacterized protein
VDTVIFQGLGVTITPWKLVGYLGVALFAGRWFVQVYFSRAKGRPVVPRLFWYMSISGSLLLLSYFTFGKNDSVGILSNLFPATIASYNLWLDITNRRKRGLPGAIASMPPDDDTRS